MYDYTGIHGCYAKAVTIATGKYAIILLYKDKLSSDLKYMFFGAIGISKLTRCTGYAATMEQEKSSLT